MTEEKQKWLFQKSDDESCQLLWKWWKSLENNKGERAILRRAKNSTEVIFSSMYHQLLGDLQQAGYVVHQSEALAAVCGLVAHVKDIGGESIAKQMAKSKSGGSKACVSGLRFRRLLAVKEQEELYPSMIRIIRLLDKEVSLKSLAQSVYWWNENTKKQWAFDYYSTAPKDEK